MKESQSIVLALPQIYVTLDFSTIQVPAVTGEENGVSPAAALAISSACSSGMLQEMTIIGNTSFRWRSKL
jgi:hypothetical protein